jgi:long-chain acyl-CoA synthetase
VLRSLDIKRGRRYAIICRNSLRNNELMHAGYWMGAVPVPINYRLAPPEIAYVLENADCELLVIEDYFAELLNKMELAPWTRRTLLVAPSEVSSPPPQFEQLLKRVEPDPPVDSGEDDDALLLYTGGTTGRGKGVRLSHRNIVSNALQIGFEFGARATDVYLHVAPMFHSADLLANAYTIAGAAHAFLPTFSGSAVLQAMQT